jgi:hypothetical protein
MKIRLLLIFSLLAVTAWPIDTSMQDLKNGPNEGKNKFQRINSNAQAIEKVMQDVAKLKKEVEMLKKMVKSQQAASDQGVKLSPDEE